MPAVTEIGMKSSAVRVAMSVGLALLALSAGAAGIETQCRTQACFEARHQAGRAAAVRFAEAEAQVVGQLTGAGGNDAEFRLGTLASAWPEGPLWLAVGRRDRDGRLVLDGLYRWSAGLPRPAGRGVARSAMHLVAAPGTAEQTLTAGFADWRRSATVAAESIDAAALVALLDDRRQVLVLAGENAAGRAASLAFVPDSLRVTVTGDAAASPGSAEQVLLLEKPGQRVLLERDGEGSPSRLRFEIDPSVTPEPP